MWKICTREGHPTILIPLEDPTPEGYVEEGTTSNPDYLGIMDGAFGRKITPLAFFNRFTQVEQLNIELASLDNPSATAEQRQQAAMLRIYVRNVNVATYVDLDRADTQNGVNTLEAMGIIGVGRANEILTAPVTLIEVPSAYRGG